MHYKFEEGELDEKEFDAYEEDEDDFEAIDPDGSPDEDLVMGYLLGLADEFGGRIARGDLPPKDEDGFYIL